MAARVLLMVMVMMVMLGGCYTTTAPPVTAAAAPDPHDSNSRPTWICADVSVQNNVTIPQVLGDWFVLELVGTPRAKARDACFKLSLTDLHEEGGNSSSVTLSIYRPRTDGSSNVQYRNSAYFRNDNAHEFILGDLSSVWRLHHVSWDSRVMVLVACHVRRADHLYWVTAGQAQDDLPVQLAQRQGSAVRRDVNLCRETQEEAETTTSSQ